MDSSTRPERWGGVFHDGEEEDDEGAEDFIQDWHSLVLLLAFTYFSKAKAKLVVDQFLSGKTTQRDHEWMVYAAASLPSCSRPIVDFFCSCFLEQTCKTDAQGYTPLIIAAQRQIGTKIGHFNSSRMRKEPIRNNLSVLIAPFQALR